MPDEVNETEPTEAMVEAAAKEVRRSGRDRTIARKALIAARAVDPLVEENKRLRAELDAARLRSIEARNPGIDMDEVRRSRSVAPTHKEEDP